MTNLQKIKRALISVSDKNGIIEVAQFLIKNNVEIISTGGTAKLLLQNNIKTIDISDFTGFPEIMDGRVKTLHPKVHGGLLGVLDNEDHQKQAKSNNIKPIDLVIINLYPFLETLKKGSKHNEIIENIDIGGPSMIRSAAKNYNYKTVITNKESYQDLINQMSLNDASTTLEFRQKMASAAFSNTANYDQTIANYFNNYLEEDFPLNLNNPATLKQTLRYGENSHQKAAIYKNDLVDAGIVSAKQLQGKELSYNNFNDANSAYNLILEFKKPACAIIKHASPCGVALAENINEAFDKAFVCDSKSAFGGIVILNQEINKELAQNISKIFFEVIIAPKFNKEALEILSKKSNLRLLEVKLEKDAYKEFKSISGGVLIQETDNSELKVSDLKLASNEKASDQQIEELIFAMSICKHVKSNAIVITNESQIIGVGAGQTSRVDSVEIACKKAKDKITKNSVLASDAFFPFADNIEILAKNNIKTVIVPEGSIRDSEVIEAANKHKVSLYFVKMRHFKH